MTLLLRNLKQLKQRRKKELKHRVENLKNQMIKFEASLIPTGRSTKFARGWKSHICNPTGWSSKFTRGWKSHIFNPTGWSSKITGGYWNSNTLFP